MTDKEILDSLCHMTDFYRNPCDVRMTEVYLVRYHADWLIGMNATSALSVKIGKTLRVGRVKAPTLKLVYDNSKAIVEFVPHSDYLAKAIYFEEFSSIYHDTDGSVLYPTSGFYIESMIQFTIIDPVQTARWESIFQDVREGSASYPDAENKFQNYVHDFVKEVAALQIQNNGNSLHTYSKHICPLCGKKILSLNWGYACEASVSNGCSFKVSSLNRKLTTKELQKLIQTGKTNMIRGIAISSQKGTKFDARLALNPKGEAYATRFEFQK